MHRDSEPQPWPDAARVGVGGDRGQAQTPVAHGAQSALKIIEFTTFALALLGALALGLGITEYLRDHAYVLAYLVAYGGFRVAEMLMASRRGSPPYFGGICAGRLGELPALALFAAAPFERTYVDGGEPPIWLAAVGLAMGLVGFWLVLGAGIQLDRLVVSGRDSNPEPPLARVGFFRYIRHPIYAGVFLAWMGWPLIYGAPMVAVATVVGGSFLLGRRIRAEEALMLARYGEEYVSYMRETDRLFPSLW